MIDYHECIKCSTFFVQNMKSNKVRLIRQMRAENERFRLWKLQKERELVKLRDQDRRHQFQLNRMERLHSKQQNVLRRKVEESAAINKRLKVLSLLIGKIWRTYCKNSKQAQTFGE